MLVRNIGPIDFFVFGVVLVPLKATPTPQFDGPGLLGFRASVGYVPEFVSAETTEKHISSTNLSF